MMPAQTLDLVKKFKDLHTKVVAVIINYSPVVLGRIRSLKNKKNQKLL